MKLQTGMRAQETVANETLPRLSKLAVVALVLAAIPCCPMLSLFGGALGLVAFQRIKRSGGRLGGRRIAMAAGITGFALSLASLLALNFLASYIERTNGEIMQQRLVALVNSSSKNDFSRARQQFAISAQKALTDEMLAQFGKATQDRYGALHRFSITSTTERGIFDRRIDVAGVFYFEHAQQLGSASFEIRPASTQYWPQIGLVQLIVEDKEHGDLRLSPQAESSP